MPPLPDRPEVLPMTDPVTRLNAALEGRYRIARELGQGGMATVYLADDLRHERKVALKVLKPELAAVVGAERFMAEIKTTANLQHPHILPLFDSGEADSYLFYVMPFVEGETLRDRIDREGQLAVDDAVRIATNLAEALDYAHRQGVIHRDVKPANVLLQEGRPVLSDFGIALAVGAAGAGRLTGTGLSLGTPHYMSPEQVAGDRDPEARSDIYALGSILYEMLVGQPPFQGSSVQSVLAKILTDEVAPVRDERPSVPVNVAAVVAKATERLPADRFPSGDAFATALRDPAFTHGAEDPVGAPAASSWFPSAKQSWALVVAAVVGALLVRGTGDGPGTGVVPLHVEITPAEAPAVVNTGSYLALSPDGRTLIYVARDLRSRVLSLEDGQVRPFPGPDSVTFAHRFSPDGQRLLYLRPGPGSAFELVTSDLSDRPSVALSPVAGNPSAAWGDDGFIYFEGPDTRGTISRIRETGGTPELVLERGDDYRWHFPEPLPGGKGMLAIRWVDGTGPYDEMVHVVDLESGEATALVAGRRAKYSPTGHLLYVDGGGVLNADRFDARSFELAGVPTILAHGLHAASLDAQFEISKTGDLVYLTETLGESRETLLRVHRNGDAFPVDAERIDGYLETVRVSPNGRFLAVQYRESLAGPDDVWLYDMSRGTFQPVTRTDLDEQHPVWAADGRSLLYLVNSSGLDDVYTVPSDMSSDPVRIPLPDVAIYEAVESADGRYLILKVIDPETDRDILYLDRQESDTIRSFLDSRAVETSPQLSPDGRWLAYVSDESGRDEVYLRRFPEGRPRVPVSRDGGLAPAWSHTGNELFFVATDVDSLAVVAVSEGGGGIELGIPIPLVDVSGFEIARHETSWTVLPGDSTFVFIRDQSTSAGLRVWVNWVGGVGGSD
jgi:serine/threonine-protein kinase